MAIIKNPVTIVQTGGGTELPEYMSAKNFTFDGNACTGYVGDNSLPEIIIPRSYSTITNIETFVGAKVLNKFEIRHIIRDFLSATFSDGGTNTHTYSSPMELDMLENDFPNDCYLVSMEVLDVFSFDFLYNAYDTQILQFPININGQSFSDGMTAFEYIMQDNITNVNFSGDIEVTKFVDGNDYQVTSVAGVNNSSGFANYLHRIILLSNLTSIGEYAFSNSYSLTSIEIPSSVKSIGNFTFQYCERLTSVTFGDNSQLTSIGNGSFYNCNSIISIEIPSGVTSIGNSAFAYWRNLTSITIPEGVTSIGSSTFSGCSSLTSIEIPSGVTSIGSDAFSQCSSLTSIEIPSGVTSIGSYAFSQCSSLTSIEIPSGVTSIDISVFYKCISLTTMTILATTPPILGNTNAISTATTKIYIPAGTLSAYQSATNWSNFADLFEELPS